MRRLWLPILTGLAVAAAALGAQAQDYPTRQITLIAPWPAGGALPRGRAAPLGSARQVGRGGEQAGRGLGDRHGRRRQGGARRLYHSYGWQRIARHQRHYVPEAALRTGQGVSAAGDCAQEPVRG